MCLQSENGEYKFLIFFFFLIHMLHMHPIGFEPTTPLSTIFLVSKLHMHLVWEDKVLLELEFIDLP